jgi:hypothetical protein
LFLAGLPATGPGERFVADLVEAAPGLGIWRDSQKWLMPFVLVSCLGFALALDRVARRLRRAALPVSATVVFAMLPIAVLPSLAWGLSGRFEPERYPAEWTAVRHLLEAQPASDRRTVVLPWSAYQRLPWNGGRAALDPALRFFPGQVLVNEDLSISDSLTVKGAVRDEASIGRALRDGRPLGPELTSLGVRYLLLERTAAGAAEVSPPAGTVLHDGPELLLVDLGGHGRPTRSPHRTLIVAADVLAVLAAVAAGALVIGRKRGGGSATMHAGAVSTAT